MNSTVVALAITAIILVMIVAGVLTRRRPGKLNVEQFMNRWQDLQKKCAQKDTWPLAIIDADKLLDDALKKQKYKGKTMGERLVAAQRDLTDNDSVWYAHKLRNKLVHEHVQNLKERDVKNALTGFRQALRDLGALK